MPAKLAVLGISMVMVACLPLPTPTPIEPPPIRVGSPTPTIVSPDQGPCAYGGEIPTQAIENYIRPRSDEVTDFRMIGEPEYFPSSRGVEFLGLFEYVDEGFPVTSYGSGVWEADCDIRINKGTHTGRCSIGDRRYDCKEGLPGTRQKPTPIWTECAAGRRMPIDKIVAVSKSQLKNPDTYQSEYGIQHWPSSRGVEFLNAYEGHDDEWAISGLTTGYWTPDCYIRYETRSQRSEQLPTPAPTPTVTPTPTPTPTATPRPTPTPLSPEDIRYIYIAVTGLVEWGEPRSPVSNYRISVTDQYGDRTAEVIDAPIGYYQIPNFDYCQSYTVWVIAQARNDGLVSNLSSRSVRWDAQQTPACTNDGQLEPSPPTDS